MKKVLRRIPGLVTAYRDARILANVLYQGWLVDRQRRHDRWHLTREWRFDTPAVRERNSRILAAVASRLGESHWGDALEVGCAEGLFTAELASRCRSLRAYDISPVACAIARERFSKSPHVTVEMRDIVYTSAQGFYGLVFVMDVLEYICGARRLGRVVAKLADALLPDGLLVVSSCRLPEALRRAWWARWLVEGGDNHVAFINGHFGLRLIHCEYHPEPGRVIPEYVDHVIAVFEKTRGNVTPHAFQERR